MMNSTLSLPSFRQGYTAFLLGLFWIGLSTQAYSADPSAFVVENVHEYFPDQVGNEWVYRGRIVEGGLIQIAEKDSRFTNVSKVMGKETIDGVEVTVFHDTNPGDQGPSDSYYRRDAAGIRYYGAKPGTTLERQLVPYQIVRFPMEVPSSFEQFNRKGLELGLDIDRDGESEKVDILAISSVQGLDEMMVPAGAYSEVIRMEAKMTMQVHLSESGKTLQGTDTMIVWFARGVGLLKYIERQTIPSAQSENERMVEVTEELEKVSLASELASLPGPKPSAVSVHPHAFLGTLSQIANSLRLPSNLMMAASAPVLPAIQP